MTRVQTWFTVTLWRPDKQFQRSHSTSWALLTHQDKSTLHTHQNKSTLHTRKQTPTLHRHTKTNQLFTCTKTNGLSTSVFEQSSPKTVQIRLYRDVLVHVASFWKVAGCFAWRCTRKKSRGASWTCSPGLARNKQLGLLSSSAKPRKGRTGDSLS